jgi:hypothetical protein
VESDSEKDEEEEEEYDPQQNLEKAKEVINEIVEDLFRERREQAAKDQTQMMQDSDNAIKFEDKYFSI